ncbi:MAG: hypothetical protein GY877_12985 [Hyphomicrobium sp.]|nr:hypothetical protein [Hyphomicrobium sp.]
MLARVFVILGLTLVGGALLLSNATLAAVKETVVDAALMKKINPDKDGTLDMDEYMALIEKLFKEANPDGDGTLDEAELKWPAGQKLLALIS